MAFTAAQKLVAILSFTAEIKAKMAGDGPASRGIPFDTDEIAAALEAVRGVLSTTAYKTAQSNAIDAALPGHTLTNPRRKAIHRAAMQAMLDGGLI